MKHHGGRGITNSFLTKMLGIEGIEEERKTFPQVTKFE